MDGHPKVVKNPTSWPPVSVLILFVVDLANYASGVNLFYTFGIQRLRDRGMLGVVERFTRQEAPPTTATSTMPR